MTQNDMLKVIFNALSDKKAEDIEAIQIGDLSIIADYFVIASATSSTHTKTLADEVEFKLKEKGITPTRVEGYSGANWIVLDYSDFVVHIFYKETREYYSLGRLWSDGKKIDVSEFIDE